MTYTAPEDPVVIAGLAIEAPGGVSTLADFWEMLASGREVIGPFPRDRGWPLSQLWSLGSQENWTSVADAGGFLAGAADFDPQFFGITPREAIAMDPQQRVGLRVAWKALEHAGINPASLDGAEVGCYMGVSISEYGPRAAAVNDYTGHRATGSALGAVAGRIAHCLGLVGPAMSVDTACASSLTALHLAANAVRAGECEWAIAGGVCVMGSPAAFFEFSKMNALAADGHCRAYAAAASGTLWGEGAGAVVVERQSRARQLGHRVYAQVLSTRVNHNGKGGPLAVPNAAAQERLFRSALQAAGRPASDIGLVEGHGTATPTGDPLELNALHKVYGGSETFLGSIKSNAGHAQAAAGILGLAKVVLCGQRGQIAPTLFAEEPNPAIDWDNSGLRLATGLQPWPAADGIRVGAVSSFGVAGTNAHAILAMPEQPADARFSGATHDLAELSHA